MNRICSDIDATVTEQRVAAAPSTAVSGEASGDSADARRSRRKVGGGSVGWDKDVDVLRVALRNAMIGREGSFAELLSGVAPDRFWVVSLRLVAEVCGVLLATFDGQEAADRRHRSHAGERVDEIRDALPAGPTRPEITAMPAGSLAVSAESPYVFRPEGDYWTVVFDGKVARLRAMRGFQYIAYLLRHPHQEIPAIDLITSGGLPGWQPSPRELAEQGLIVTWLGGGEPILDARARAEYRDRLRELCEERERAERDHDLGLLRKVEQEIDAIEAYLTAATRRGGGARGTVSPAERARVNVRNCFTAALRAVASHNAGLARHFVSTIKTGTFCSYVPDRSVDWML